MTNLPDKPSLQDIQSYVAAAVQKRGFSNETTQEVFGLLVEEIGELAKALRKTNGLKIDAASRQHNLEEEAADVLFLLSDLCNKLEINLDQAFRTNEVKNDKRTWS